MARTLTEALAKVREANTKADSLIALHQALRQQLKDALEQLGNFTPEQQQIIDQIFDEAEGQAGETAAAIDENTSSGPAEPI